MKRRIGLLNAVSPCQWNQLCVVTVTMKDISHATALCPPTATRQDTQSRTRARWTARKNLLEPRLDPEAVAALGNNGAPLTTPRLTTTPTSIRRDRHTHKRAALSPLLCSAPTLLLLMTTRSRPSTPAMISTAVSCGWRRIRMGVSAKQLLSNDAGEQRRN